MAALLRIRPVLACAVAVLIGGSMVFAPVAVADEPAAAESAENESDGAGSERLKQWIEELDAAEFSKRQEAGIALRRAGKEAFDLLIEAAASESRERSARAIQVIEFHFRNGDEATKQAAKEALEKIAKSSPDRAARRAANILKPPATPQDEAAQLARGRIMRFRALQGGAMVQRGRSVRVSTDRNGVKTIDVKEANRTVKLVESPQQGITLTITETKNGKPQVKVYQAKDGAELKKKDAGAFKVYEETRKFGGLPRIQIQIGGFPGVLPPPAIPQRKPRPTQLKAVADKLRSSIEKLEKSDLDDRKALERAIAELRSVQQQLEKLAK